MFAPSQQQEQAHLCHLEPCNKEARWHELADFFPSPEIMKEKATCCYDQFSPHPFRHQEYSYAKHWRTAPCAKCAALQQPGWNSELEPTHARDIFSAWSDAPDVSIWLKYPRHQSYLGGTYLAFHRESAYSVTAYAGSAASGVTETMIEGHMHQLLKQPIYTTYTTFEGPTYGHLVLLRKLRPRYLPILLAEAHAELVALQAVAEEAAAYVAQTAAVAASQAAKLEGIKGGAVQNAEWTEFYLKTFPGLIRDSNGLFLVEDSLDNEATAASQQPNAQDSSEEEADTAAEHGSTQQGDSQCSQQDSSAEQLNSKAKQDSSTGHAANSTGEQDSTPQQYLSHTQQRVPPCSCPSPFLVYADAEAYVVVGGVGSSSSSKETEKPRTADLPAEPTERPASAHPTPGAPNTLQAQPSASECEEDQSPNDTPVNLIPPTDFKQCCKGPDWGCSCCKQCMFHCIAHKKAVEDKAAAAARAAAEAATAAAAAARLDAFNKRAARADRLSRGRETAIQQYYDSHPRNPDEWLQSELAEYRAKKAAAAAAAATGEVQQPPQPARRPQSSPMKPPTSTAAAAAGGSRSPRAGP